jgi:cobalt-zinc-cadmium efflux system outer membrane protein
MHDQTLTKIRLLRSTIANSNWGRFHTAFTTTLLLVVAPVGCARAQSSPPSTTPRAPLPGDAFEPVHVLDTPLPDPTRDGPVSLHEILAYADHHAPRLLVARQRLALGEAAIEGASPVLPENLEVTVGAGPRLGNDGTYMDLQGSLSQRFEIAGERGLRLEAAQRTRERFEAELDEARWEVHRDVHAAFHRGLVARESRTATERLLQFQERLLDITQRRLRAGDVSQLDVRLAEGELAQARVALLGAEQDYLRARLDLAALAGWPAAHPPEPAGALDEPRDPPNSEVLTRAAQRHQPRLRTLSAARNEAIARARAAARDAWPEPTLGVQVTREGAPAGLEETIVLGTLSLPIPVAQRNQGARAEAQAEARIAEAEQTAFNTQLDIRIEQDRTAVMAAAARVRTYGGEILPTFEENLRLIERAFELGEIDILQVSVARERFLRVRTDVLDAYTDYFQAVADLEASIGTDLWSDERHDEPL